MRWYFRAWKNCLKVDGRASRKEFWYFILFTIIFFMVISFIFGIVDGILGLHPSHVFFNLYLIFYILISAFPLITVTIRRLHDANFSAWLLLTWLIPGIGHLYILFLTTWEGDVGKNAYGADPRDLHGKQDIETFNL